MVTEVWTIEQQAADRERWAAEKAREEERKKAESEKILTIKRFLKMGLSNTDIARGVGVAEDVVLKVRHEAD